MSKAKERSVLGARRDPEHARERAVKVFVPSEPVRSEEHLYGRDQPMRRVLETLAVPGRSVFVYGERGVGKTSLAQTAANSYNTASSEPVIVACHPALSFGRLLSQISRRLLEHPIYQKRAKARVEAELQTHIGRLLARFEEEDAPLPDTFDINDAVDLLNEIAKRDPDRRNAVVVIDELDVVEDPSVRRDVAFLVKQLGDRECPIKFMFVGIAENVEELLQHHESASRYMATVKLDPLPINILRDLVLEGFKELDIAIPEPIAMRIACIADGFAHFAHLIALKVAMRVIDDDDALMVGTTHYETGLRDAIEDSESWLKNAYDKAVQKYQDRYERVLWAAADHWQLERSTEYMYTSHIRISEAMKRDPHERDQFTKCLLNLKTEAHGPALVSGRRSWYKFRQSMLRGYCRMIANAQKVEVGLDYLTSRANGPIG